MTQRVYGISIDKTNEHNIYNVQGLTNEEKEELINNEDLEVYTLEGFFYYLNEDMIDTENMYWFIY